MKFFMDGHEFSLPGIAEDKFQPIIMENRSQLWEVLYLLDLCSSGMLNGGPVQGAPLMDLLGICLTRPLSS